MSFYSQPPPQFPYGQYPAQSSTHSLYPPPQQSAQQPSYSSSQASGGGPYTPQQQQPPLRSAIATDNMNYGYHSSQPVCPSHSRLSALVFLTGHPLSISRLASPARHRTTQSTTTWHPLRTATDTPTSPTDLPSLTTTSSLPSPTSTLTTPCPCDNSNLVKSCRPAFRTRALNLSLTGTATLHLLRRPSRTATAVRCEVPSEGGTAGGAWRWTS